MIKEDREFLISAVEVSLGISRCGISIHCEDIEILNRVWCI